MNTTFGLDLRRLEVFGELYSTEVSNLLEKLREKNDVRHHCLLIKQFARKYTLLPSLWQYWNSVEKGSTVKENESLQHNHFGFIQQSATATKHFNVDYSANSEPSTFVLINEKPIESFKRIKSLKEGLFYPHHKMDKLFEKYDRNSSYALSQKELNQYEKALNLYKKLKDCIQNPDEWFKCLKETNDYEYIINSCEYRLADNPYDNLLWDSYLHFLKTVDVNMMLRTYSRYCRLFLFDYSKLEEYYAEIVKAQIPGKVQWWTDFVSLFKILESCDATNKKMLDILIEFYSMPNGWSFSTFDYECNIKDFAEIIKSKEALMTSSIPKMLGTNQSSSMQLQNLRCETSSSSIMPNTLTPGIRQRFPFISTIMRYLLENASPPVLQKLQMCCKELYYRKPLVYCQRLSVKNFDPTRFAMCGSPLPTFFENALIVFSHQLHSINFDNYHLVNSLELAGPCVLPKIRKCTVKYLTISNQSLNENDLEFLVFNVEFLELDKVIVTKEDGTVAPVDYIIAKLAHVPNVKLINPLKTSFTETTAQNLAALRRRQKFKSFFLNQLPVNFEVDDLCKFVAANAVKDAEMRFIYDSSLNELLKIQLGQSLWTKLLQISRDYKLLLF